MTKIYKKKHTSKAALKNHLAKIQARGGVARVRGMTIEYGFPKKGSTKIVARSTTGLIREGARKGYRRVSVVWKPYRVAGKRFQKRDTLDLIADTSDIVSILRNPNVKEIKWTR